MHRRREQALKLLCLSLGLVLAFQLIRFVIRGDPTKRLVVPALPSLPDQVEAKGGKFTNSAPPKTSSNSIASSPEAAGKKGTKSQMDDQSTKLGGTNSSPGKETTNVMVNGNPVQPNKSNDTHEIARTSDQRDTNSAKDQQAKQTATNLSDKMLSKGG